MVLTTGRLWDKGKNVGAFDAAARMLSVPTYAAGALADPSGRDGVILRDVRPLGHLPSSAVGEWLSRAPVYASTALYEPFGLGVLEAAQAGCALVLSDIPTFRELWSGAAIFVDPRHPGAIAEACERLATDEAEAARWGALARARAARFTVAAMAAGTLGIYADLGFGGARGIACEAAA
jgi:glycosyltransferase involved in cell wall biosynthesis